MAARQSGIQDVLGDALLGIVEKLCHRARMGNDAVHQPRLEGLEVVRLQVLGTAGFGVPAAGVERPEVIGPDRELPEDVLDGFAHEPGHPLHVLLLDLLALGVGHPEHAHGDLARERPVLLRLPHEGTDPGVIEQALVLQGPGLQQLGDACGEAGTDLHVGMKQPRRHAREAVEMDAVPRVGRTSRCACPSKHGRTGRSHPLGPGCKGRGSACVSPSRRPRRSHRTPTGGFP